MKILLVVTDFGVFGGGERVAANLARVFHQAYGHTVGILSFQKLAKAAPFDPEDKLSKGSLNLDLYHPNLLTRIIAKFKSLIRLRTFLRNEDWQIAVGIGTYPSAMLGLTPAGKAIRIGCEHASLLATPWAWSVLRGYAYPRLDHLVVLTGRSAVAAHKLNRNISVIANSLSMSAVGAPDLDHRRVLGIGRLDANKSFGKLIEAFGEAVKEHPSWNLCIIGNGDQRKNLQAKITDLGLDQLVSIQPPVLDIQNEYMNSSIVALTSSSEGLPLVLLEAQGYGLPCVAFDCDTGPAEIIEDGKSGFLIAPGDIPEFGRRLSELMGSLTLRSRFSAAAIRNAEKFSEAVIGQKWQVLMRGLLQESNTGH
jgi:glycosyltransferase involved in cell wall biosynthesis